MTTERRWSWWRYNEQVQKRRAEGGIHGFPEATVTATCEHMAAADMADDYEAALAELRAERDNFALKLELAQAELHELRIRAGMAQTWQPMGEGIIEVTTPTPGADI